MPLTDADVDPSERLNDGLPESLAPAIDRYGLKQFKLKLSGNLAVDAPALERIAALLDRRTASGLDYAVSLDGNEHFHSLAGYRSYWESLSANPKLAGMLGRLLFVEQPLERSVALDPSAMAGFRDWTDRPPTIIDESDAEIDSCRRAIELGYAGTSHKNCKGVFKSIASACYLNHLRQSQPERTWIQSAEDMGNIGPIALLQDLAVAAALGIESVERNGHHYFAGLSMFPPEVGRQVLTAHRDLYETSPNGWPTLTIRNGRLNLQSINQAPLGVGFELDLSPFATVEEYRQSSFLAPPR
jgi:hypothetical protein